MNLNILHEPVIFLVTTLFNFIHTKNLS